MRALSDLDASSLRGSRRSRLVVDATIGVTWALMLVGALTRASMAGIACPDWPLCHGYLVPPLDRAAYPGGGTGVYEVYLEFSHRALAAVASIGSFAVAVHAWRRRLRLHAAVLLGTLGLQVAAGAVTVWLGNAPHTVVLHLALAVSFLSVLLLLRRRLASAATARAQGRRSWSIAYGVATALTVVQMLVGALVSSSAYGLACAGFPFCEPGRLWPRAWTEALAWQILHRGVGVLLGLAVAAILVAAFARRTSAPERRWAAAVAGGLVAQALLGGANVWLGVPPWASALHLALAVALFGTLAWRTLEAAAGGRPTVVRPG